MFRLFIFFLLIGGSLIMIRCSDDDEPQPFTVNFTNLEAGISSSSPSAEVGITFSRGTPATGTIELSLSTNNLTYGSTADFFTTPEAVDNVISLSYDAGAESVSFTVTQGEGLNIQQDETIAITLTESAGDFIVGENTAISITFSENFIARSGTIELNGGGEAYPNQTFVDLSKLEQTTVDKHSWDLGFYTASGEHRVILNGSANVMVRPLDKFDLTEVTAEDTSGFAGQMVIPQFDPSVGSIAWVDSPDGDLTNTAIGDISATDSENAVFIVKRDGEGRNWKKVRVLRNMDNYSIQYGDIDATSISTTEITKNDLYSFVFFDLDNGEVSVEPEKSAWDIMYSTYTESLNLGAPGLDIPYGFKDYIIINRYNVKAGTVLISDFAYESFVLSDISNIELGSQINVIGANWREGGGPISAPSLHEDRFFVIEDSGGNTYKLKFNRLTSIEGERGLPEFSFELLN